MCEWRGIPMTYDGKRMRITLLTRLLRYHLQCLKTEEWNKNDTDLIKSNQIKLNQKPFYWMISNQITDGIVTVTHLIGFGRTKATHQWLIDRHRKSERGRGRGCKSKREREVKDKRRNGKTKWSTEKLKKRRGWWRSNRANWSSENRLRTDIISSTRTELNWLKHNFAEVGMAKNTDACTATDREAFIPPLEHHLSLPLYVWHVM